MSVNTLPISSFHIIGSRFSGGAERFYLRLVKLLNQNNQSIFAIVRNDSYLYSALQDTGISTIALPFANGWDLWTKRKITKLIHKHQPNIVQTYMGRATRLTYTKNSPLTKHVARLGGYYKIDGYYRHADNWVGNTADICDYLDHSGLEKSKIHKIGNFVPQAQTYSQQQIVNFRRHHNIPENAKIIFALGRFTEKKGFSDLLTAFSELPATIQGVPVILLIAGDGEQKTALNILSSELKISIRVRWLGWLDEPGLAFSAADLFVCPSRHEPLGNVILEAWSYKKPVLSTSSQGAREIITDQVNGVLTACNQTQLLAGKIQQLLTGNQQFLDQIAEAGFHTLTQKHSEGSVLEAYRHLYQQLAGPHS